MADPLSLLRQYNINNKDVVEKFGIVCFGDTCWPKTVKTNYFIYSAARDAGSKTYYTLEALLYFLKNADLQHPTYVKQAANLNIPVVQRPDRKDLLAYLRGELTTSASLDKAAPIELPKSYALLFKELYPNGHPSAGDTGGDSPSAPKYARMSDVEKVRQEFAARLDAPKMKKPIINTDVDGLKNDGKETLRDMMSVDQIAALKAKRLAKKRATIVDADIDLDGGQGFSLSAATSVLLEMDSNFSKEIQSKERVWRNRLNILQCPSKNFAKSIFPILAQVKAKEEQAKNGNVRGSSVQVPAQTTMSSSGAQQYNRYDQERFTRNDAPAGFRIDTTSSYHGFGLKNSNDGSSNSKSGPVSGSNQAAGQLQKPTKRVSRTPIIIIPATSTSLIQMVNVATILQELRFVDPKECTQKPENELLIQRKKPDNSTVPYRIICNASKLNPEDWNRVVAVFVQGPTWQFKGWPWKGNPVEIFANIKAFHIKFDETKLDNNVAKWSVDVITLSRSKRHLDRANLLKFWSTLDTFISKFKQNFVRF